MKKSSDKANEVRSLRDLYWHLVFVESSKLKLNVSNFALVTITITISILMNDYILALILSVIDIFFFSLIIQQAITLKYYRNLYEMFD